MALHKAVNPFGSIVDGCLRLGLGDSSPPNLAGGQVSKGRCVGQAGKITERLTLDLPVLILAHVGDGGHFDLGPLIGQDRDQDAIGRKRQAGHARLRWPRLAQRMGLRILPVFETGPCPARVSRHTVLGLRHTCTSVSSYVAARANGASVPNKTRPAAHAVQAAWRQLQLVIKAEKSPLPQCGQVPSSGSASPRLHLGSSLRLQAALVLSPGLQARAAVGATWTLRWLGLAPVAARTLLRQ